MQEDQVFLESVIKQLVDHPHEVRTERSVDEMGVLLSLHVHPDDMSQVIGKMGRTASSVRTLLRIVGMKHNSRVNMKIIEPEEGKNDE